MTYSTNVLVSLNITCCVFHPESEVLCLYTPSTFAKAVLTLIKTAVTCKIRIVNALKCSILLGFEECPTRLLVRQRTCEVKPGKKTEDDTMYI